ncbi:MAG: metallophosphoesterase [Planctomycetes bacterium]|nr:metallophosphoesterase [Planctomycetota bacterium]
MEKAQSNERPARRPVLTRPQIKLVVSDLHVGRGAGRGQLNEWESFFFDDSLADLLRHYSTGAYGDVCQVELILNGDIFDLLQVDNKGKFYDTITEGIAVRKLRLCLQGHPVVTTALKEFIARPSKSILYVPGNHDMEFFFPRVRQLFSRTLTGKNESEKIRFLVDRPDLTFDGIRIEHGQQYEAIHACDFDRIFLTRRLSRPILNLPWGSLFMHNVINRLKKERPYIDHIRPFSVYLLGALVFDFRFALKAMFLGLWFFLRTRFIRSYVRTSRPWQTFRIMREELQAFPNFDRIARQVLAAHPGTHVFIMGHTHTPKVRAFPEGTLYINTGTWMDTINLEPQYLGRPNKLHFVLIDYTRGGARPDVALKEWIGPTRLERDVNF